MSSIRIYILALCWLLCWFSYGQEPVTKAYVDSLKAVAASQTDSSRLRMIIHAAYGMHVLGEIDSAIAWADKGLELVDKIGSDRDRGNLYMRLSALYQSRDIRKSLWYTRKNIELRERLNSNPYREYTAIFNHFVQNLHVDSALYYYNKCLALVPEEDKDYKAYVIAKLADVYQNSKYFEHAITQLHRYRDFCKKHKLEFRFQHSHSSLAARFRSVEKLDSMKYYVDRSFEKLNVFQPGSRANLHFMRAEIRLRDGNKRGAHEDIEQGARILFALKNQPIFGSLCNTYANLLRDQGNYVEAIQMLDTCMIYNLRSLNRSEVIEGLGLQIHSLAHVGEYERAYKEQIVLDSLEALTIRESDRRDLRELEIKYQAELKDNQLLASDLELKQRNNWLTVLGGILAIAIASIVFLILYFRQKEVVNKKLKKLDNAKNNFFANISHELRTPLTLILGPLEKIMGENINASIKTDVDLAYRNGERLLSLVNEIMELSLIENGELVLHEKPVELHSCLKRIFFSFHSLAEARQFTLNFIYDIPAPLWLALDESKFEKVLNNFITNAFKFSPPGSTITLQASRVENMMCVEVIDQGKGIPLEEQDLIFNRYYQVNHGDQLLGGAGIGLAYSKEIADLFGGRLEVESEINKGSIFRFLFPLKTTEALDASKEVAQTHLVSNEGGDNQIQPQIPHGLAHILIVEDNPEMSNYLSRILAPDYHCLFASDGKMALDLLSDSSVRIDLISSDVMMPVMDGFTLLHETKKLSHHQHTPFILLTARALQADKLKGFHLGVDDYLTKPFNAGELKARIANLLENKENRSAFHLEIEDSNIQSYEADLIAKAKSVVEENISETSFKVTDLARAMNYSPRQLARITNKLTGFTPVEFIREIRLLHAYALIEHRRYPTIAEVRYEVGIENSSYFSKKFSERFGIKPNELLSRGATVKSI